VKSWRCNDVAVVNSTHACPALHYIRLHQTGVGNVTAIPSCQSQKNRKREFRISKVRIYRFAIRILDSNSARSRILAVDMFYSGRPTFRDVLSVSESLIGFLLAKDSLIKSSHASHPIAGQGAAAWHGRRQAARSTPWSDG